MFFIDHINRRTQWQRPTQPSGQESRAQIELERRRQFAHTMRRRIPTSEPEVCNHTHLIINLVSLLELTFKLSKSKFTCYWQTRTGYILSNCFSTATPLSRGKIQMNLY